MNFQTASLQALKDYCQENAIAVVGDKRKASTWRTAAIAFFNSTVESDDSSLGELFTEADRIGNKYQTTEEVQAVKDELAELAQEVLGDAEAVTSDKTIELYQQAAVAVVLAVAFVIVTMIAIGRTLIEHDRTQTAIEWVKVRASEFVEWIRSSIDREYQSIVSLGTFAYHGLMD